MHIFGWLHQLRTTGVEWNRMKSVERHCASVTRRTRRHWSDGPTSSRLSQDSTALSSAGISGRWSCICLPDMGSSRMSSSSPPPWLLLDAKLACCCCCCGGGCGTGRECSCRKSCTAADALSLTGLTSASRAAASSARTRPHSFSISLMLALTCCRGEERRRGGLGGGCHSFWNYFSSFLQSSKLLRSVSSEALIKGGNTAEVWPLGKRGNPIQAGVALEWQEDYTAVISPAGCSTTRAHGVAECR